MSDPFSTQLFAPAFDFEGRDRVEFAYQFGVEQEEPRQFAHPLGIKPTSPKLNTDWDYYAPHPTNKEWDNYDRERGINRRLQQNIDLDAPGPETQLPDFLQDPFEGNETGPEQVWTDQDHARLLALTHKATANALSPDEQPEWDHLVARYQNKRANMGPFGQHVPQGRDTEWQPEPPPQHLSRWR